jgi:sigma-B regulation protein RsbQ
MNALQRNNVVITGQGTRPVVFAHGFGCDQHMWRFVAPAFADSHRLVLFDHIGCGKSELSAYDNKRHATLEGYALDMVEILEQAELQDAVIVGHSAGAVIGLLAANRSRQRVASLVLVSPSPRYLNDPPDYVGGFEREDIEGLIDMMESNMLGWTNFLAPVVMGSQAEADLSKQMTQQLTQELKDSFCASDPYVTRRFALATFLADNRADLPLITVPALIIQCSDDAIAPRSVGEYMHSHIEGSHLRVIEASGHCPHMTHPQQTIALIQDHLAFA